jgi:hypothetical protein
VIAYQLPDGRMVRVPYDVCRAASTLWYALAAAQKRGYSREFTPQTDRRVRFEVDRIPPTLYDAVKAKAKREGVSLRALTLRLWKRDPLSLAPESATGPVLRGSRGIDLSEMSKSPSE